jgi:hypothetical protein
MLAAFKYPAPTSRRLVEFDGLCIIIDPATVRVIPELIVTFEFTDAFKRKVKDAQLAVASTVTVIPLFIVTVSDEVGTADPPQVVVLLQFPVTLAVRCATNDPASNNRNTTLNPIFRIPLKFPAFFKEFKIQLLFFKVFISL